ACALHVHIDCRDFGYQDVRKVIKAYKEIEPVLFAASHYTRHNNPFCNPCGQRYYDKFILGVKPYTKDLKKALAEGVYGPHALESEGRVGDRPRVQNEFQRARRQHYANGTMGQNGRPGTGPRYFAVN